MYENIYARMCVCVYIYIYIYIVNVYREAQGFVKDEINLGGVMKFLINKELLHLQKVPIESTQLI